jgi:hypothetical protein
MSQGNLGHTSAGNAARFTTPSIAWKLAKA